MLYFSVNSAWFKKNSLSINWLTKKILFVLKMLLLITDPPILKFSLYKKLVASSSPMTSSSLFVNDVLPLKCSALLSVQGARC